MTEEYTIVEEKVEKNCKTCGIKLKVNKLGMCAEAAKIVQDKCLMCRYSKNAPIIEQTHKALGIDRPLEDNWQPIGQDMPEVKLQYKRDHKIVREMQSSSVRFKCVKCGAESAFPDGIQLEKVKKPKE